MEAALAAFLSAIPSVIGAVLILIVGWIIAGWIGGLVARALRALRFDQLAAKAGVQSFLARAQMHAGPADVLGATVKWYVRLIVVLLAANAVGLTAVSKVVNDVLAFIPNLVVAVIMLAAFAWLAGFTRTIVRGALAGSSLPNGDALASIAYVTVFAFGIVAAADQVGVASTLINTLFMGVDAAFALAFGLAFGLGGRDEAAQSWRDWRGTATNAMRQSAVTSGSNGKTGAARPNEETERLRREEMVRSS